MRALSLSVLLYLFSALSFPQDPMQFVFRPIHAEESAISDAMVIDAEGNSYIAVTYTTPFATDFVADTAQTCQHTGAAVHKINYQGNRVWSAIWCSPTATATFEIGDVAIASNGDVLLTGQVTGNWDLDPGPSVVPTDQGSRQIFLRLNSEGQYVNHFRGGTITNSVTICPLPDGDTLVGYNTLLTRQHTLARVTPSWQTRWAFGLHGSSNGDLGPTVVSCSNDGSFYLAANFRNGSILDRAGNIRIDVSGNHPDDADLVVSRYNADGDLLWHRVFRQQRGLDSKHLEIYSQSLTTDAQGNVYLALSFVGQVDFDPNLGDASFTSLDERDSLVVSLSNSGEFRWAHQIGGPSAIEFRAITVTPYGAVFVGGDSSATPPEDSAFLLAKLDANTGQERFVRRIPIAEMTTSPSVQLRSKAIAHDSAGNVNLVASGQQGGFVFGADDSQGVLNFGPLTATALTTYDAFGNIRQRNRTTREIRAITNAASFQLSNSSPGALATIFGSDVGEGDGTGADAFPLPISLCGIEIRVTGGDAFERNAPILFCNANQVNFQIPWETPLGFARLQILGVGSNSQPVEIYLQPTALGVFFADHAEGRAAIQIASGGRTGQLLSAANPVPSGEFLTIYVTGVGLLQEPAPASGQPNPPSAVSAIVPVEALLNDTFVPVSYVGLSPGFVGLNQVNVQIPAEIPPGEYEMQLRWSDGKSQPFRIWVD